VFHANGLFNYIPYQYTMSNIKYRRGSISNDDITDAKLLYAQQIYENVIHPDTNEITNRFGRLSFIPIGKSLLVAILLSQLT